MATKLNLNREFACLTMSKLPSLILSSFAAGFGLCSIVFALFTLLNEVDFSNIFRLILTGLFFLVNLGFTINYFSLVSQEIHGRQRAITRGKPARNRA